METTDQRPERRAHLPGGILISTEGDLLISHAATHLHISVFDNKNRRNFDGQKYSETVSLDTESYRSEVICGRDAPQFKSLHNGRHQLTEFGAG